MPPEGNDLIFDHRHNAAKRAFCSGLRAERGGEELCDGQPGPSRRRAHHRDRVDGSPRVAPSGK
jgi:hypothetical protein